jgi:hypothetical protein
MNQLRSLRPTCLVLSGLALFATIACSRPPALDLAAAYLSADLVATDGGSAQGRVDALLSRLLRQIGVVVSGLDAHAIYEITADGVVVLGFETDANGEAQLNLDPEALGLDPRGRIFAVRELDGPEVLVMRDPDATNGGTTLAEHAPLAAIAGGSGATRFSAQDGEWRFRIEIAGVEPAEYGVWIDGVPRATIDAASGAGHVDFASAPGAGELLLDFDPRLSTVEILRAGEYVFIGSGHAQILGIDMCLLANRGQALIAESSGLGLAVLTTRTSCRRSFRVTIGGVPMGDYDLVVGGVVRGTFAVGADENGATEGELRFSSIAEGGVPLDFDPLGEAIEVRQGTERFFWLETFAP